LKEVQGALNDCQGEICDQLATFQKSIKSDMLQMEGDVIKMIERKANFVDVQDALSHKADAKDLEGFHAHDFQEMNFRIERINEELRSKVD